MAANQAQPKLEIVTPTKMENNKNHNSSFEKSNDRKSDGDNRRYDRRSDNSRRPNIKKRREFNREPEVVPKSEKKPSVRSRLFIGNLTSAITEPEYRKLFEPYGTLTEVFLNASKGFGFIRYETRISAENAKGALDSTLRDGRHLRVRFATQGVALKVKNLSQWVSNELLEQAFGQFGEIERAVVVVNDRGRSIGEGIVEFSKKAAAMLAFKTCNEGVFLMTSSPRPITVEFFEARDEDDGLMEKNISKNNPDYMKDRQMLPRLAEPRTFEYEYGIRWKKLYAMEEEKREMMEKEILEGRRLMEEEMEQSFYEHESSLLKDKIKYMEEQATVIQRETEARVEAIRTFDEQLRQEEALIREREEEILRPRIRSMPEMYGQHNSNSMPRNIPPPPPPPSKDIHEDREGYDRMAPSSQHYTPPFEQGYNKRAYPDHQYPEENKRRRF